MIPAGSGQPPAQPPRVATASPSAPDPGKGRLRLGDLLVEQGLINKDQLEQALGDQRSTGKLLGELLVERGLIPATILVQTIANAIGLRGCVLRHGLIDPSLLATIGPDEAQRLKAIPMFKLGTTMTVAMAEPQSLPAISTLKRLTGCEIRPVFALESNVLEYIKKYSGGGSDIDEFLTSLGEREVEVVQSEQVDEGPTTDLGEMVAGSPVVNLVNLAFLTAVKDKASDIHIEPDKKGTRIRYRIDGVLRDLMKAPMGMHAAIVSRVKVIGKMDIAEKRLPQEGRVRIVAEKRDIDLRVSSMPTLLGEKIVVRILDKSNLRVRLEHLGFRQGSLEAFRRTLELSHGLNLVTGPTGSGKTTTLYAGLSRINTPDQKIITIEDPVEYHLDGINQIQVDGRTGLSFARGLRAVLRHDPDVVLVGEIRDRETAEIAVQASLTGHLVLSTLHTNDAPGAIARLVDMGVEPYLVASTLELVVAQRLVRLLCRECRRELAGAARDDALALLPGHRGAVYEAGGCRACNGLGYRGRSGIFETMPLDARLRHAAGLRAPAHELRRLAAEGGLVSLRQDGLRLVREGLTSVAEVLRNTHEGAAGEAG